GDRKRGDGGSDAGAGAQPSGGLFDSPAPDQPIENLKTSGSGDGGFPMLLLLLGAIAGTCAGFAIWRMRRESGATEAAPSART
ncbi:MAG: hypothetical protein ACRDKX_08740, partial [Solirubrobacterales bacterium]